MIGMGGNFVGWSFTQATPKPEPVDRLSEEFWAVQQQAERLMGWSEKE